MLNLKIIICSIKKIVLCFFIIYGYNLFAVNFNLMIPLNIFSLITVFFLGAPGLVALVLFRILVI